MFHDIEEEIYLNFNILLGNKFIFGALIRGQFIMIIILSKKLRRREMSVNRFLEWIAP